MKIDLSEIDAMLKSVSTFSPSAIADIIVLCALIIVGMALYVVACAVKQGDSK